MELISGNIFIRKNFMRVGDVVQGHTHNFDHTTIFHQGKFSVKWTAKDGRTGVEEFQAPTHALIKKDVVHEISCLEDGEFWCVFSHRTPQGDVVQEAIGWMEAYG